VSRATRAARLRARLESAFAPAEITITDESHAGAAGGASHFRVRIVAAAFRGVAPVARHRLVYRAVGDLMQSEIHALAIEALPASQA